MKKTGYGESHAKLILVGEHAVVYGVTAIAIPLKAIRVQATTSALGNVQNQLPQVDFSSELYTGLLSDAPVDLQNISALVREFLQRFGQTLKWPQTLQLRVESQIPFERGMGSSAAIATAVLKSLIDFSEITVSTADFNQLIDLEETIQHGNPSGLDALVVQADQGYFFQRGQHFEPLSLQLPGYFVIVDSGIPGKTGEALKDVAQLRVDQPELWQRQMDRISLLAPMVKTLLTQASTRAQHKFGRLLTENQQALQQLQVSTPELDQLIQKLNDAGALGAKLTGGGRGGCVFGYFADLATARAAQQQFTEKTWLTKLATESSEQSES